MHNVTKSKGIFIHTQTLGCALLTLDKFKMAIVVNLLVYDSCTLNMYGKKKDSVRSKNEKNNKAHS